MAEEAAAASKRRHWQMMLGVCLLLTGWVGHMINSTEAREVDQCQSKSYILELLLLANACRLAELTTCGDIFAACCPQRVLLAAGPSLPQSGVKGSQSSW